MDTIYLWWYFGRVWCDGQVTSITQMRKYEYNYWSWLLIDVTYNRYISCVSNCLRKMIATLTWRGFRCFFFFTTTVTTLTPTFLVAVLVGGENIRLNHIYLWYYFGHFFCLLSCPCYSLRGEGGGDVFPVTRENIYAKVYPCFRTLTSHEQVECVSFTRVLYLYAFSYCHFFCCLSSFLFSLHFFPSTWLYFFFSLFFLSLRVCLPAAADVDKSLLSVVFKKHCVKCYREVNRLFRIKLTGIEKKR